MTKKFITSIYLYNGKAVNNNKDLKLVSDNPVELACKYNDNGCDELIIFDLSNTDEEHEQSLDIIKEICADVDIPVIGAGNVKRMEDIKKILYAGCKKGALNFSKQGNKDILKEVSEKFGKEKIVICYSDKAQVTDISEEVSKYSEELIYVEDDNNGNTGLDIPTIFTIPEINEKILLDTLSQASISGVTGAVLNNNSDKIQEYKKLCSDNNITVNKLSAAIKWDELKLLDNGLVPVVVQDYRTDQVLMVAYMNEEAYNATIDTGKMHYYSRSRDEQWLKGETSGHFQFVKSLYADCDKDTILAKVKQIGAACHTGSYSCFFNEIAKAEYTEKNPQKVLDSVYKVICDRKLNPREGSYTNYLFDKGIDKILKKVGEESTEIVIAAKNPNSNEIVYEMADFLYHMMVLMAERDVKWEDITDELARR